jgi:metallo-beta-lactamase class B
VMAEDVSLVQSGGKSDFHYGKDPSMYFPATKVDRVLHDGDKVVLGDSELTAHLTAGHTKGCTTWTMQVMEKGKPYQVVLVGSLSLNPGYKLINNPTYPSIAKDYKHSFETMKSLPCDIFLGAHAGYFQMSGKYSLRNKSSNPFIDPQGYKKHVAEKQREFYAELHTQQARAKLPKMK